MPSRRVRRTLAGFAGDIPDGHDWAETGMGNRLGNRHTETNKNEDRDSRCTITSTEQTPWVESGCSSNYGLSNSFQTVFLKVVLTNFSIRQISVPAGAKKKLSTTQKHRHRTYTSDRNSVRDIS